MARTRRLDDLVASSLDRLLLPGGLLVVGLSGGADSAALAYLCIELDREVRAVHINHGLPNSPMMEKAAADVADTLRLPLEVRTIEVPNGASPEGQARMARYSEFTEATVAGGSLLTAHTRDDNVETVVFNLIRGTGARGLAGIPYHRPHNVYRPLLTITRSETRELATLAGLPFVDDPMNDDMSLTRNVVRSRIIPMLSELNPRFSDSVARMASNLTTDNDYLDTLAAQVLLTQKPGSVGVAVGDLVSIPNPAGDRVLKTMLVHALGPGGVTAERVDQLWSVAEGTSEMQQLEGRVAAVRSGALLVIDLDSGEADNRVVTLTPGRHRQAGFEFDVARFDRVCQVAPLSRWQAVFPIDTELTVDQSGVVSADGEQAWDPGIKRHPAAWYEPGSVGYLSVLATEVPGWTSSR